MKESIGTTWILGIVITFIILFSSFVSISINWSKCYKVKDEMIFLIQKNKGLNTESIAEIRNYLAKEGYRSSGKCPDSRCWYGFKYEANGNSDGPTTDETANFCVRRVPVTTHSATQLKASYYQIKIFFTFDVPIIGDLIKLTVDGETAPITNVRDGRTSTGEVWTKNVADCQA